MNFISKIKNGKAMKLITALLFCISIIYFSGCATLFSGSKETINLTSEPTGAEVYIDGFNRGITPLSLSLKKGKEYMIEFKKENYNQRNFNLTYSLGAGWVVLDILAGLVGIIVDAVTGAWNGFETTAYKAVLEPIN